MLEKLIFRKNQQLVFIDRLKVFSIQKEDSRIKIVTSQEIFYSNKTLKEVGDNIGDCFFRLRRDIFINVLRINKVDLNKSIVIMDNNEEFIIAKRKKNDFISVMKETSFCIT